MKGMLIKDFSIIKMQSKLFVLLILIAILMAVTNNDVSIVIPYLMSVFSIFTINTIAYDDMDGGMTFLLTLPVKRKEYVFSKYILGVLLVVSSLLISQVIGLVFGNQISGNFVIMDNIRFGLMMMGGLLFFLGLMLPLIFKYGPEKGRTVLFILVAALALIVYGFAELLKTRGIDIEAMMSLYLNEITGPLFFILIGLIVYIFSYFISKIIVEKKEY